MALRSLSRKGIEVGARVGKSRAHNLGAERKASSLVGQGHGGHFGRPPTTAYGQGSLGARTQLFKLVETDLMSKELTRYGPSDAEHLGLHPVQNVLADIASAASTFSQPILAVPNAQTVETGVFSVSDSKKEEKVLAVEGLESLDSEGDRVEYRLEAPAQEGGSEKMAIKRTYQPSTLKRKRKHGFLYRAKTRLGKKIMQRRQEKGRWRLGI